MINRKNAAIAASMCLIFAIVAYGSQRTQPAAPTASAAGGSEFWDGLAGLCGNTYEGVLTHAVNPRFNGTRLVMHVFQCEPDRIAIRLGNDVDNDGVTRVHAFIRHPDGRLELRHTYRNADGTSAEITDHGGFANNPGLPGAQIFPADVRTVDNQPSFWNWVWMIEVHPAERYVYFIQRMGTQTVARHEYDLSRPLELPNR